MQTISRWCDSSIVLRWVGALYCLDGEKSRKSIQGPGLMDIAFPHSLWICLRAIFSVAELLFLLLAALRIVARNNSFHSVTCKVPQRADALL